MRFVRPHDQVCLHVGNAIVQPGTDLNEQHELISLMNIEEVSTRLPFESVFLLLLSVYEWLRPNYKLALPIYTYGEALIT